MATVLLNCTLQESDPQRGINSKLAALLSQASIVGKNVSFANMPSGENVLLTKFVTVSGSDSDVLRFRTSLS